MTHRIDHLRQLLDRHHPASDTEAEHLDRMRALLVAGNDALGREHYEPGHFTASAFVLSPDLSELLLIFHGKLLRWLQPGGHIDPEDVDVVSAALREVREETGLQEVSVVGDGLLDVDVHEIPARGQAPSHEHFDVRILLRAGTRSVQAGSDAQGARWVALGDVANIESDESVTRAVARIQRMLPAL